MTTNRDAEAVLAASNAWARVPQGAARVQDDEDLAVAYPDHLIGPTSGRVLGSERTLVLGLT